MAVSTALFPHHLPAPYPLYSTLYSYKMSCSFPVQMLFNAVVPLTVLPSLCEMLSIVLLNPFILGNPNIFQYLN